MIKNIFGKLKEENNTKNLVIRDIMTVANRPTNNGKTLKKNLQQLKEKYEKQGDEIKISMIEDFLNKTNVLQDSNINEFPEIDKNELFKEIGKFTKENMSKRSIVNYGNDLRTLQDETSDLKDIISRKRKPELMRKEAIQRLTNLQSTTTNDAVQKTINDSINKISEMDEKDDIINELVKINSETNNKLEAIEVSQGKLKEVFDDTLGFAKEHFPAVTELVGSVKSIFQTSKKVFEGVSAFAQGGLPAIKDLFLGRKKPEEETAKTIGSLYKEATTDNTIYARDTVVAEKLDNLTTLIKGPQDEAHTLGMMEEHARDSNLDRDRGHKTNSSLLDFFVGEEREEDRMNLLGRRRGQGATGGGVMGAVGGGIIEGLVSGGIGGLMARGGATAGATAGTGLLSWITPMLLPLIKISLPLILGVLTTGVGLFGLWKLIDYYRDDNVKEREENAERERINSAKESSKTLGDDFSTGHAKNEFRKNVWNENWFTKDEIRSFEAVKEFTPKQIDKLIEIGSYDEKTKRRLEIIRDRKLENKSVNKEVIDKIITNELLQETAEGSKIKTLLKEGGIITENVFDDEMGKTHITNQKVDIDKLKKSGITYEQINQLLPYIQNPEVKEKLKNIKLDSYDGPIQVRKTRVEVDSMLKSSPTTTDTQSVVPIVSSTGGNVSPIMSDKLGGLSEKYETSGRGSSTIGWDRTGKGSYGKYQIATGTGTMDDFLNFLSKKDPELYKELNPLKGDMRQKDGVFAEKWKQLANQGRFKNYEHEFIKRTHYDAAFKQLPPKLQEQINNDRRLQEVLWSTSVHHGATGGANIFKTVSGGKSLGNNELINAIYNERGADNGMKYFRSSSSTTRTNIVDRFQREKRDALAMDNTSLPITKNSNLLADRDSTVGSIESEKNKTQIAEIQNQQKQNTRLQGIENNIKNVNNTNNTVNTTKTAHDTNVIGGNVDMAMQDNMTETIYGFMSSIHYQGV